MSIYEQSSLPDSDQFRKVKKGIKISKRFTHLEHVIKTLTRYEVL